MCVNVVGMLMSSIMFVAFMSTSIFTLLLVIFTFLGVSSNVLALKIFRWVYIMFDYALLCMFTYQSQCFQGGNSKEYMPHAC